MPVGLIALAIGGFGIGLTEFIIAGFAFSRVTWLLIVFGVGLFLGNLAGGRAADRALTPTLVALHFASDTSTMASSANIAAFNVGNAIGAYLGGRTIAAGFGYTSPAWVGALLPVAALAVLLTATALSRVSQWNRLRDLVTVA